jgi:hypothetical protein
VKLYSIFFKLLALLTIFQSSFSLAEDSIYVCLANNVNGQEVSDRMAISNYGIFIPTIVVSYTEARVYSNESDLVTDIRGKPTYTLSFNDVINDWITELAVGSEYDRYQTTTAGDKGGSLIAFKENGRPKVHKTGTYPIYLVLGAEGSVFILKYDCWNEKDAENQLDIKFIKP